MDDVGVVQCGSRLGLLHESALALGIGNALVRQDLYGGEAIEMGIPGFVDNSHAAAAQFGQETVVGDRPANHAASGLLQGEGSDQSTASVNIAARSGLTALR